MVKTSTTTSRPLSNCEKNRQDSQQLVGRFVPRCLPNGDFDSLQCHGHPGTADCWCSDLEGREIPGTLMEAPNYPSCDDGKIVCYVIERGMSGSSLIGVRDD